MSGRALGVVVGGEGKWWWGVAGWEETGGRGGEYPFRVSSTKRCKQGEAKEPK